VQPADDDPGADPLHCDVSRSRTCSSFARKFFQPAWAPPNRPSRRRNSARLAQL
jgi:hypothetical protein